MDGDTAPEVIALGEALVEMMRPARGVALDEPGVFEGPFPSGAPAIFADACARLGLSTGFAGTVGDDAFGRLLRERLGRDGVDVRYLEVAAGHTTGTAFVAYRPDGSRDFVYHLAHAASGLTPTIDPAYLRGARLIHITGSTLAANPAWRALCLGSARAARENGAHVSFDPNLRPELLGGAGVDAIYGPILDLADVVLPSGPELAMLTGIDDPQRGASSLIGRGVGMVVLKRGAAGCTLFTGAGMREIGTQAREEVDPTGAGDAFAAGVAYGLLRGLPLEAMLRLANAVGGLAVTRLGPMEGLPRRNEAFAAADLEH